MIPTLQYKGYAGSIEYNAEDDIFAGKLEYIRDLVTYEGATTKELKQAFQEAVDDYLQPCVSQNRLQANTPLSEKIFNTTWPIN